MMIAQVCNLQYGDFVHTLGDATYTKITLNKLKLNLQEAKDFTKNDDKP